MFSKYVDTLTYIVVLGLRSPTGFVLQKEKMHTSNTTYCMIVLFIIYVAPNYSMTTYFTAPPLLES